MRQSPVLALLAVLAAGVAPTAADASPRAINGKIVFDQDDGPIFTVDPDGTDLTRIAHGHDITRWSTDGSRMSMAALAPDERVTTALAAPDGSGLSRQVIPDPTLNLQCPAWAPDDSSLVCEGWDDVRKNRPAGLFRIRSADWGGLVRLTRNPHGGHDVPGDHSPDGRRLVFLREGPKARGRAIFVADADGSHVRRITPWGLPDCCDPRWSPDGRAILFSGNGRFYLVRPDGRRLRRLRLSIRRRSFARQPSWSPDGRQIAFSMLTPTGPGSGVSGIYRATRDGRRVRPVATTTQGQYSNADWGTAAVTPEDPSRAHAGVRRLACGDTITTSTTLHADLIGCRGNGVVIGADGVVLDLNGHSIGGDAIDATCPATQLCDVGVANPDGHDHLTVTGGTVRDFAVGVLVGSGAHRNRLRDVALTDNTRRGAVFDGTTRSEVTHSSFADTGVSGLLLFRSTRAHVAHNTFSGLNGYAMVLRDGVFASRVSRNTVDLSDHGMVLDTGGGRNRVDHNLISRSGGSAIDTGGGARGNVFEHNRLVDNGDGFISGAVDTAFRHNVVTGSGRLATDAGGFGIVLDGAVRNSLERNVVTGGHGPAVLLVQWESPGPPQGNALIGNRAASLLDDGIFVDTPATGTLLRRNTVFRSGDDGIDVRAAGTTVGGNVAFGNADLGIEAASGVVDAGGNRGFGNGNPAQCVNVAC